MDSTLRRRWMEFSRRVFKQQAYDIAVKKFNGENIKVQSVEIATDEKIQNLMSLFW